YSDPRSPSEGTDHPGHRGKAGRNPDSHRSRSLPDPARDRRLRDACGRGHGKGFESGREGNFQSQSTRERPHQHARHGTGHERVIPQLCHWIVPLRRPAVPHPRRAVQVVQGSRAHHARDSYGLHRCAHHSAPDGDDAERDVADGRVDAGGHLRIEQHPDRGVHASAGRTRKVYSGGGDHVLPGTFAASLDDLLGNHHRHGAHGIEAGNRQRAVCPPGARHHRRAHGVGRADRVHRACRLLAGIWQGESAGNNFSRGDRRMKQCTKWLVSREVLVFIFFVALMSPSGNAQKRAELPSAPQRLSNSAPAASSFFAPRAGIALPTTAEPQENVSANAQTAPGGPTPGAPMRLTRRDAERLAIKNNPRISVGRLLALAQHEVYRETRSAELPTFAAAITAVNANEGSRVGAGALNAPRLLEHAGAGVTLSQLITDFGRTSSLVAAAKLREKAQDANALATIEDIVMATDQAFYNALQSQALLKVAQQTVSTRQSVENQISELAKNNLKSNLDLTFADVNLSQAKLLQLDAQNNLDSSRAALAAVLGFDRQITFELNEEDVEPPPPPADLDGLIRAAFQQRPDLQ